MSNITTNIEEIDADTLPCKAALDLHDLCVTPGLQDTTMRIHDADGDELLTVTKTISAFDLNALLKYANARYQRGLKSGRNEVRLALQAVLTLEE